MKWDKSRLSSLNRGNRLRAGRRGFNFRQRPTILSPGHGVRNGSGVHQASSPRGTTEFFQGIKRPRDEDDS